jgi:predicted enzyme related to lactoylglutathione lyase
MRMEVCIDCADPVRLAAFWAEVLGATVGGGGDPYCDLRYDSGASGLPVLTFQRVPEARVGKNRLHLDLYVGDPPAEIARVGTLGATPVGDRVTGGDLCAWWQVMADPEGNEFCICAGPSDTSG